MTDHLPTLTEARRVFLGQENGTPVEVSGVRMHKGLPLFSLRGIDTMEKAQSLRGTAICLPGEELQPLEEGEFFLHDLEGLTILGHRGKTIGKVEHIVETGGPPLLCGKDQQGKDFLIPFASGTVSEVDLREGVIRLHPLPGLVDEDTE